jgi:hypothetical protein
MIEIFAAFRSEVALEMHLNCRVFTLVISEKIAQTLQM